MQFIPFALFEVFYFVIVNHHFPVVDFPVAVMPLVVFSSVFDESHYQYHTERYDGSSWSGGTQVHGEHLEDADDEKSNVCHAVELFVDVFRNQVKGIVLAC